MTDTIKHYTASVLIISDGQPAKALLTHHRKFDKWMPAGGHQEPWENPIETAIRETKEETGIDVSNVMPAPILFDAVTQQIPPPNYFLEEEIPSFGDKPLHYHLDHIYVVKLPEQIARHDQKESHAVKWFTLEQTESLPTFENVHKILRQELKS